MSKYPVPCVVPSRKDALQKAEIPDSVLCHSAMCQRPAGAAGGEGGQEGDDILDGGWVQDINGMLSFNRAFATKGMLKHVVDD